MQHLRDLRDVMPIFWSQSTSTALQYSVFGLGNLNGIAVHNFIKAPLIKAFIKASTIDVIFLSETFLDSTIPLNDERL